MSQVFSDWINREFWRTTSKVGAVVGTRLRWRLQFRIHREMNHHNEVRGMTHILRRKLRYEWRSP